MSSITEANYDGRKYICCPHDGDKGVKFRAFCDRFLTALAIHDLKDPGQDYTLDETALGIDDNGVHIPPGAHAPSDCFHP